MTKRAKKIPSIMFDGIDGCGKSTVVKAFVNALAGSGLKIFNLPEWCKKNGRLPKPEECANFDVLLAAEPTNVWVGAALRDELIKSGHSWEGAIIADAFSLDRAILYKRLLIPLGEAGKLIVQERGVSTSLVYQPIQKNGVPLKKLMMLTGNIIALNHPPGYLVIIECDPENAMKRIKKRLNKQDDSIFERLDFLRELDLRFHSQWFRDIWADRDTKISYFNANVPLQEMAQEAEELAKSIYTH